jgi:hypothetical protein
VRAETFLDGKVTILLGDVRAMLKTLPDDHFDCVVTSPPYWGLRDYGTGRWEGGDIDCAHERVGTDRTPWANSVKGPGKATLIELNPEYATLARARIEAAFMGKDEGARHMSKQLGKDRLPFEPGTLFATLEEAAE